MDMRNAEGPPLRNERMPVWHVAILAGLMIAQIVCAAISSTASTDTNRDVYFAQQIASAQAFPLVGPEINQMLHLGPIWFYVLAIAAWLVPNASAVTAFMAAIGAAQFPLAYVLGRRFGSAREGLLFALALAIPGLMAVSLVSMTHTIAVIPCLLLGVFAAIAYRAKPDWKHALWLGVICALSLHAHPTTFPILGVLILWSAMKTGAPSRWFAHAGIVLALIALSFAPMLYAQWRDGSDDLATTANYAHAVWSLPSLSKGAFLIYAQIWYGPKYLARFWLDLQPAPARLLLGVYVVTLLLACAGLGMRFAKDARKRKLIAMLLGLLILQATFVCAIRPDMPPWMTYAQWPLIAALIAIGLEWVCSVGRVGRGFVALGLIVTTLWSATVWAHMAAGKLDFVEMKPAQGRSSLLANVREYNKERFFFRMPRIPFREVFSIGAPLCKPTTLFGHYAYFADITYGVGAMQMCGSRSNIQLGGPSPPDRRTLVGLRREVWQSLRMQPAQWIGVLGVSEPSAIWESIQPLYPETPRLSTLPHRLHATIGRFVIEGEAAPDQAVLIAHRAHRYLPFSIVEAKADGVDVKPDYADLMTAAYRLPAGFAASEKVHWRIEVEGAAEFVDALTLASNR